MSPSAKKQTFTTKPSLQHKKHTHTYVRASRKSHNMEFIVSCICFPIENVMKIKYMIGKYVNYLNNLRYTLFPIVCLGDTTCDVVCNDNLICQQISFSILGFKVRVIYCLKGLLDFGQLMGICHGSL